MTDSDYEARREDLYYLLSESFISEGQYHAEMEALQEQWEEEGED